MDIKWSVFFLFIAVSTCALVKSNESEEKPRMLTLKTENGKERSTSDVLKHIGMTRVKNPGNHHRKRLASQSRKSHSGDSHMYIIKLPPNPYYYDTEGSKKIDSSAYNVNRIPIDFKSNGKPGKIYHWNLPVVKKMVARKTATKNKDKENQFKPSIWVGDEPYRRVSYFKPKKPSKQTFQKYFPGNGKPHTLYVIDGKKRTSSTHRNNHTVKE